LQLDVDASPIAAVGGIDASDNWSDDVQLLHSRWRRRILSPASIRDTKQLFELSEQPGSTLTCRRRPRHLLQE
jgi:hypothetical protein